MARPKGSKTENRGASIFVNVGECVVQINQNPDKHLSECFYDENGVYCGRKTSTIKDVLCYFKGATYGDWVIASKESRKTGIEPIVIMKRKFLV